MVKVVVDSESIEVHPVKFLWDPDRVGDNDHRAGDVADPHRLHPLCVMTKSDRRASGWSSQPLGRISTPPSTDAPWAGLGDFGKSIYG